MKQTWKNVSAMLKSEDGQGMVEYGIIVGLIAVVVIAAFAILGPKISTLFKKVELDPADTEALKNSMS